MGVNYATDVGTNRVSGQMQRKLDARAPLRIARNPGAVDHDQLVRRNVAQRSLRRRDKHASIVEQHRNVAAAATYQPTLKECATVAGYFLTGSALGHTPAGCQMVFTSQ